MGHLPLDLQTATSGHSDERYFVGIAHDFNSGIRLYCPTSKSTITRHSYKFLDTVTPNVLVYVISDRNVVFSSSLSDDSIISDTSFTSPEEAGPPSLNLTVSSTEQRQQRHAHTRTHAHTHRSATSEHTHILTNILRAPYTNSHTTILSLCCCGC